MVVGIIREIKKDEYRVGLVPATVAALCQSGHTVLAESSAGVGSGISDEDYADAGAEVVSAAAEVWARTDMVVKVKEPLPPEYALSDGAGRFHYLHLAARGI